MWVTLDIGNTRVKYALWEDNGNLKEWGSENSLIDLYPVFERAQKIISVNVRESFEPGPYQAKLELLNHQSRFPFKNLYRTPHTLGMDRAAAVAGAMKLYPNTNCLVIDAGTCIKFDFIGEKGEYFGGSIGPGLQMRFKALNLFTGKLPLVEYRDFEEIYGQSTEESILCGVIQGFLLETEGRIEQFRNKFDKVTVIVTGGDGEFLGKHLKTPNFADPLLIQHGIYAFAKLNF